MLRIIIRASDASPADYEALRPRTEQDGPAPVCSLTCGKLWREPTYGEVIDYFAETAPAEALVVIEQSGVMTRCPEGFRFLHHFAGWQPVLEEPAP